MSLKFDANKLQIDEKTKLIIFGYIRNEQKILNSNHPNNSFYTIAQLIIYHILCYYHEPEYFTTNADNIILSDDKRTITVTQRMDTTCYGVNIIPSTNKSIHKWKFSIFKPGYNCCGVGIDEAPGICINTDFYKQKNKENYAYINSGTKWSKGYMNNRYGDNYRAGDILDMILDLYDGNLSYSVNNVNQGICYKIKQDKSVNYIMAVSVYSKDQSVKLLKYSFHRKK